MIKKFKYDFCRYINNKKFIMKIKNLKLFMNFNLDQKNNQYNQANFYFYFIFLILSLTKKKSK